MAVSLYLVFPPPLERLGFVHTSLLPSLLCCICIHCACAVKGKQCNTTNTRTLSFGLHHLGASICIFGRRLRKIRSHFNRQWDLIFQNSSRLILRGVLEHSPNHHQCPGNQPLYAREKPRSMMEETQKSKFNYLPFANGGRRNLTR